MFLQKGYWERTEKYFFVIVFLIRLYYKIEAFLKRYPLHIKADFSKFPPYLNIQSHDSFVSDKYKEISAICHNSSYKKLIKKIFETVEGCNYLLFDDSHRTEFIQFWIGDGTYVLDFPMGVYNTNEIYKDKLINLLKKNGFKKRKKNENKLEYKRYEFYRIPGKLIIRADFGDDFNLVTEFSSETLKNILKIPLEKLEVALG